MIALGLFSGFPLMAGEARADLVSNLAADREIASGGDAVSVQLKLFVTGSAVSNLSYAYAIPASGRYLPNSVSIDGLSVPDTDTRILVDSDSVRVSISNVAVGTRVIDLRIRAAGPAGVPILHDAVLAASGLPTRTIHAPPTWIEDENALVYVPPLLQDAFISESEPVNNFGASPSLELRTGSRRRGLLQFDIGAVLAGLPSGMTLIAARLELWPTAVAGNAVSVTAHRVRQTWAEGSQSGAVCTSGVTWQSRNCIVQWTAGGDFDAGNAGTVTLAATTRFASIDIQPLALEWITGAKPNQGLLLDAAAATSGSSVSFAAREGKSSTALAARLVLIVAPTWAYGAKAVKDAKGDIVPASVITNVPNQRFVYTVKPSFDGGSTGMNRVQITVPSPFSFRQVDSVTVAGRTLARSIDEVLVDDEYEDWSTGETIDLRFAPSVDGAAIDPRVVVVFRAGTPTVADLGKNFTALVDHDRRGYAPQAVVKGDANGLPGDGNTWTVVTTAANVVSVEVVPPSVSTRIGEWVTYSATAHYSEGTVADVTPFATWVVSPTGLGTFDPGSGALHAEQVGSGIVVAGFQGVFSAPASLVIDPPTLLRLTIAPASASVPAGRATAFHAFGVYSNGDSIEVTNAATWASTDTTIAEIVSGGLVRGRTTGLAGVRADLDGQSSPVATLEVTPPVLESIRVTPADTVLVLGLTASMRAVGSYSDSSQADLTSAVSWSTEPPGIVDIDADGLATTLAMGTTSVQASLGSVSSAPVGFTVEPATVVAIALSPSDTTIALGRTLQLHAHATWSDGTAKEVTSTVDWRASPAGIASVDASGLVRTQSQGSTAITAMLDSTTSLPLQLTVGPAVLASITVSPTDTTIALGDSLQLHATGRWSDGATSDITGLVAWSTSPAGVATVDASGLALTFAEGKTAITADLDGVTSVAATLTVQVVVPVVDSLVVSPRPLRLPRGARIDLTATAYFDDGTNGNVSAQALWTASDTTVVQVGALGRALARSNGSCSIVASWGGTNSDPCSVTVDSAALDSLVVAPADTALRRTSSLGYRARGHSGSWVFDLTSVASWSAADTTVTTFVAPGSLVTRNEGTTTVQATLDGFAGTPATLRVTPAEVVTTEVAPLSSTLRLGSTKQMSARAIYSDGTASDATDGALWVSDAPAVVYVDPHGQATAVALGSARITATDAGVTSTPATLTVLPAVTLEGIATMDGAVLPGSTDRLVHEIRVTNRYTDVRRLVAVRFAIRGPVTRMRLRLDDGDGAFEPASDVVVADGVPSAGSWAVSPLAIDLPVGTPKILFASVDVSLTAASQGDTVDAWVAAPSDLYWNSTTAVVAPTGFPLQSPGVSRVEGLVLAQIGRFPTPADSVLAGSVGTPVLELDLPSNGPLDDALQDLLVTQIGSARDGADISRLRLESGPAPWTEIAVLASIGGGRWATSGIGLPVPAGGRRVRVVADLTTTAQSGRTLQLELPRSSLAFESGRTGPMDAGWTNPNARSVRSLRVLTVLGVQVTHGETALRRSRRLPLLAFDVTVMADFADTLRTFHVHNISTNDWAPPAASPNSQIEVAELWVDADADGAIDGTDTRLDGLTPAPGNDLVFGGDRPLDLVLQAGATTRLLVTVSPDSLQVRDGERLGVRLASPADVVSAAGLAVQLQGEVQTLSAPVIDGQSAGGYTVHPIGTVILTSKFSEGVALDIEIPANGIDPDTLQALNIVNVGSASGAEIASLRLYRDDGDGVHDSNDLPLGTFAATGERTWRLVGLQAPLPGASSSRFFVTVEPGEVATSGRSFQANVPPGGITVRSGNDGPIDRALDGGGPILLTVANQVIWVAGVAGSHAVRPDVRSQPVLVLETLNTYSSSRSLDALRVHLRGTADEAEFDNWELFADDNRNGSIDDTDRVLAVATPFEGRVFFAGFTYTLESLQQQRLLVAYSGALGSARDGSTIDAAVESESSFDYDDTSTTTTAAQFELDSAGQDVFDGCVLRQVQSRPVSSRTLGGGEQNVLLLDLHIPSNGMDADQLSALDVEIVPQPGAAVLGEDLDVIRLWAESDLGPGTASFDPAQDALLATLIPGEVQFRFDGLSMPIPPGGRTVYVTADVAQDPTDGRVLQLQLPENGLTMVSGNDGPLDGDLLGVATHRISRSQILSSVATERSQASVGQPVDVEVVVENRGGGSLSNVRLHRLDIVPPRPGSLVSGPDPVSVDLAPGATDTFTCRFQFDTPGTVRVEAVAGLPDSSVMGNPSTSGPLEITRAPSGLALELLSNVPGSVYRGQRGIVPMVWRFAHPDTDSLAAPIAVRALAFRLDDGGSTAQPASAVFDQLEVRTANRSLATFVPVPDSSVVRASIDPPLELLPGEERDVSVTGSIAVDASANSFRLRLLDANAVQAEDFNSGAPVNLQASLPWSSPVVAIRSIATSVELAVTPTLPPTVNRGQAPVGVAQLELSVPGAPGASDARLTRLALDVRRPDGSTLDLTRIFRRFTVSSGPVVLLETSNFDSTGGQVLLPLTIAKTVTSGAPETIDLEFEVLDDAPQDSLSIRILDADQVTVVDAIRGTPVAIALGAPDSFPVDFGSTAIQSPAGPASIAAASRVPGSIAAGAADVPILGLRIVHRAPPGSAELDLTSLVVRTIDATGAPVVPRSAITGLRLAAGGAVVAMVQSVPDVGSTVRLAPVAPVSIAAEDSIQLDLSADLASPAVQWLRFVIDLNGVELHDANEPLRTIAPTGTIPFSTELLSVLSTATAVALGVPDDPPANAARGARDFEILSVRVAHPGSAGQSDLTLAALTVLVRDLQGAPLPAQAVATGARLRADGAVFEATLVADSLRFDLAGAPALGPGEARDLQLDLDVDARATAQDVRLGLDASALVATSGGPPLPLQPAAGTTLPYLSPSIHIVGASLEESFANYPNPFAAGRESTHIVFNLVTDARVTVDVFDLTGERVIRLLQAGSMSAGLHDELSWDGRNGDGAVVRNGTYLLRMVVDGPSGGKFLRKLAVLR